MTLQNISYTGKISVLFMISVTNLYFSEIESSGTKP